MIDGNDDVDDDHKSNKDNNNKDDDNDKDGDNDKGISALGLNRGLVFLTNLLRAL